ncbi:MAG: TIGR01906 family membrane protein [Dehalococcoidia bacterium]
MATRVIDYMNKYAIKTLAVTASILFVICIPTFLITTDLRFAVNDIRLYEYGFNKYQVSAVPGLNLNMEELLDVADQLIDYFNSDEEFLDIDLFNEREVAHMKDVKGLVQLAYFLQLASMAYIVVFVAINFALKRGAFWRGLARRLVWGSGATIGLLAALGLWAATGFETLFLLFHLASFSNDLWQLSPGDNLLLMFPQEFFNDATLFVAGAAIAEAIIIAGIAWGIPALRGKARHKALSKHSNENRVV